MQRCCNVFTKVLQWTCKDPADITLTSCQDPAKTVHILSGNSYVCEGRLYYDQIFVCYGFPATESTINPTTSSRHRTRLPLCSCYCPQWQQHVTVCCRLEVRRLFKASKRKPSRNCSSRSDPLTEPVVVNATALMMPPGHRQPPASPRCLFVKHWVAACSQLSWCHFHAVWLCHSTRIIVITSLGRTQAETVCFSLNNNKNLL